MSTSNQNKIKNNCPIGFFDSGVGGLSVYSCFKKALPCENTLYYGDIAHLPYGNKTKEELVGYARTILDFYKTQDVKAVVIACNTSSAQAYDVIKDEELSGKSKLYLINDFDRVLSLDLLNNNIEDNQDDSWIISKIEERRQAKATKDYEKADAIREELLTKGIILKDNREGTTFERK